MEYRRQLWRKAPEFEVRCAEFTYETCNTSVDSFLFISSDNEQQTASGLPRSTLLGHAGLTLLVPYLHNRIRAHALSQAWPDAPSLNPRRKAWDLLNVAETLHAFLTLVNFVAFLWKGRYRTLSDRVLQMRLVPSRRAAKVDVSYEFMNRQMVWHAFTVMMFQHYLRTSKYSSLLQEFLLFLLPLLSKRAIRRLILQLKSLMSKRLSWPMLLLRKILDTHSTKRNDEELTPKRGKLASLPETQCAICAENVAADPGHVLEAFSIPSNNQANPAETIHGPSPHPIYNPYETSCGHIYCYQCIAERMMRTVDAVESNLGWECLRCGEFVKEAHRYRMESEGEVDGSEYDSNSDLDISTIFSDSTYTFSETGFSE